MRPGPQRQLAGVALPVGGLVLLGVLAALGAFASTAGLGLPEAPLLTRIAVPLDLYLLDLVAAVTVGCALIGGVVAPRPDPGLGRLTSISALGWLLLLLLQVPLVSSEIFALPLGQATADGLALSLLTGTTLGQVLLAQIAIVTIVAILGWVVLDRATGVAVAAAALLAATLPGVTGHSGITGEHWTATVSLALHIGAASAWLGGLVAVLVLIRRGPPEPGLVIRRFSLLALICVVLLAESGLLNASLRLAGTGALLTSTYGMLLLAKVALLIVLIGLGWQQRETLARRVDQRPAGPTAGDLSRLAGTEIVWLACIVGLSVALSRSAPTPATPGQGADVGSLLMLAVGIPVAVASLPVARRIPVPRLLRAYPEAPAVIVVASLILLGTAMDAALPGLLGAEVSAVIVGGLLLVAGITFTLAAGRRGGWPAIALVALALPGATWWLSRTAGGELQWWGPETLALLACEGALGWLALTNRA